MSAGQELHDWGAREGLSPDTITVLLEQGFNSLADLRHLTPNDVMEFFQKTKLLPLAKCLALRNAIGHLSGGAHPPYSPPERGYSPPDDQFQLGGPSPYAHPHGHYDHGFSNPPRQTNPPREPPYHPQEAPYPPAFQQYGPHDPRVTNPPHQTYQPGGADYHPQAALYRPAFEQHGAYDPGFTTPPRQTYQPREPAYHPQAAPYPPAFAQETYTSQGTGRCRPHHGEPGLSAAIGATSIGGRQSAEVNEEFRLLLLGKTGSGKSTTGNTIFGEKLFQASADFRSVTADCELKRNYRDGRKMEVMDSPGLFDTSKNHEQVGTVIIQSVAGMHPGPNAILYVVKVGRYTDEEYSAYNRLKALFDESITRYMIVLFTGGDDLLRDGQTLEVKVRSSPDSLKKVLSECNNRCVLFDNNARNPRPQVERLLGMVRQLDRQNGGPYVCPKYMKIGESLEAEVARRMEEVDKKELERQKYVQQLQKQTEETQQALSKTKEEMERKEQEQKRQMKQLAQQQQQQMKALQQQMEAQKLSDEKRLQEERALRERQQEEQQKMVERMEQQRREDQQRFQEMEEEHQRLEAERVQKEREMREEWELRHEREMNKVKDEAVKEQSSHVLPFLKSLADVVLAAIDMHREKSKNAQVEVRRPLEWRNVGDDDGDDDDEEDVD